MWHDEFDKLLIISVINFIKELRAFVLKITHIKTY